MTTQVLPGSTVKVGLPQQLGNDGKAVTKREGQRGRDIVAINIEAAASGVILTI